MGNRLSKITTRTGDGGETGLGDGTRVSKCSDRVQALGDVDELNSAIGVLVCEPLPAALSGLLTDIQHDLFDLGGELAIPGYILIKPEQVARLEEELIRLNGELQPLKEFILPGGTRAASLAHLARTICRRAERAVIAASAEGPISSASRQYLNRLSDLLFVIGRTLNRLAGRGDVLWQRGRGQDDPAAQT
jgi:cob(I)alamin adenosyltransferase